MRRFILLGAAAFSVGTGAVAAENDKVFMRRPIPTMSPASPAIDPDLTDTPVVDYKPDPTLEYDWRTGSWSPSAAGNCTRTDVRSVQCIDQDAGTVVAESNCTNPKPATSTTYADSSQCTYSWVSEGFEAVGTCGVYESSRNVACVRDFDGASVSLSLCDSDLRPASSRRVEDYSGCTFELQDKGWKTCIEGTQEQALVCERSDGVNVSLSNCGVTDIPTQDCSTVDWDVGEWGSWSGCSDGTRSRTRSVSCISYPSQVVRQDSACGSSKPNAVDWMSCRSGVTLEPVCDANSERKTSPYQTGSACSASTFSAANCRKDGWYYGVCDMVPKTPTEEACGPAVGSLIQQKSKNTFIYDANGDVIESYGPYSPAGTAAEAPGCVSRGYTDFWFRDGSYATGFDFSKDAMFAGAGGCFEHTDRQQIGAGGAEDFDHYTSYYKKPGCDAPF